MRYKAIRYIVCSLFCIISFYAYSQHALRCLEMNEIKLESLNNETFYLHASNKKLLAIIFLSPECPLSQNYTFVLNAFKEKYNAYLDVIGIFPKDNYTDSEYNNFQKKYKVSFALAKDNNRQLISLLNAVVTPEIFLFDIKRNLLYNGAIDNWVTALGKKRKVATAFYFDNAIYSYLNNEPIDISYVKPIGCFIN